MPLDAIPNQQLSLILGGLRWEIRIKYARGSMVIDVARDGTTLMQGHRIAAGSPIPPYPKLQTEGVLWLVTDGEAEPDYTRFGVDQTLVYVAPGNFDMTLDLCRTRVGIEIAGQLAWYEDRRVRATGTKYADPTKNEATVTITDLSQKTRDYLLTETSPFNQNRTLKRVVVGVGRQSGSMFRLFVNDIVSAELSSPPDIDLIIKAKTQAANDNNVVARSAPAQIKLSDLARSVASDLGLTPLFEATDLQVANYSHSGPALKQVEKLQETGAVTPTSTTRPWSSRTRTGRSPAGFASWTRTAAWWDSTAIRCR